MEAKWLLIWAGVSCGGNRKNEGASGYVDENKGEDKLSQLIERSADLLGGSRLIVINWGQTAGFQNKPAAHLLAHRFPR
jgi:hypothetical protein